MTSFKIEKNPPETKMQKKSWMGDETGTRNAEITRKILSKTISKLLKNYILSISVFENFSLKNNFAFNIQVMLNINKNIQNKLIDKLPSFANRTVKYQK